MYVVEPDYQKTLQLALKQGRFLAQTDDEQAPAVTVIDETLANKYFPGGGALGQYLILDPNGTNHRATAQIVGIVGHINQWGLDTDASNPLHAEIFLPLAQMPEGTLRSVATRMYAFVRGNRGMTPSYKMLRQRLLSFNRELTVYNGASLEQLTRASIASKRFTMALLVAFATVAVFLASIGIYGVLSYIVGQRTQEIGVRIALGAARFDVLRMILADGARMTLTGVLIGIIVSLGLTQLMSSMLFGVKPTDPLTFAAVVVCLCLVALLACYVPVRKAMRVDPALALRTE
jgi:hypothetical protein